MKASVTKASEGLAFSFSDMEKEIRSMTEFARKFVTPQSIEVIGRWQQNLNSFQQRPRQGQYEWEIGEDDPITTNHSAGFYEPDGEGALTVFGTLSAIWQIEIENSRTSKRPNEFVLTGKASTKVRIWEFKPDGKHHERASWRFEVGNVDAPGCHFHIQVMGDTHDGMFPKSMAVPRFPCLLVTPMDALEFLLAEIFQDQWNKQAAIENIPMKTWADIQRRRLTNLLDWKRDVIQQGGSPWTTLKSSKPQKDTLSRECRR